MCIRDSLSPAFAADVVEGGQHFPVGARGEREGTELVGVIIPYDLGVAAEPGVGRGGIRDALAIAAEIQIDHQAVSYTHLYFLEWECAY